MIDLIIIENADRESIKLLNILDKELDFNILLQACDRKALFESIDSLTSSIVDVVIFNIDLFDLNGLAMAKVLTKRFPKGKFIIIKDFPESLNLKTFLEAGFKGYLDETATPQEIIDTVRRVAKGYLQIAPSLSGKAISNFIKEETSISDKVASIDREYSFKFDTLEQKIRSTNKRDRDLLYIELAAQTNNLKLELRSRLETLQERIDEQVKTHLDTISNQFGYHNSDERLVKPYKFALFTTQLNNNRLSIGKLEKQLIWLSYGLISLGLIYFLEKIVVFVGN